MRLRGLLMIFVVFLVLLSFVDSVSAIEPPIIDGITVIGVTNDSAIITWRTDEYELGGSHLDFDHLTDGQVEYGITTAYSSLSNLDTHLAESHDIRLSDLAPNTLYHFRILTRDDNGYLATSSDQTFTTLSTSSYPGTIYYVDKDNVGGNGCSDSGAGDLVQPLCTLTEASLRAVVGDTVYIREGTYTDTSSCGASITAAFCPKNNRRPGMQITFKRYPGDSMPVIMGDALNIAIKRSFAVGKIWGNFLQENLPLNRCYTRLLRPSYSLQDGFLRSKKMAKS